MKTMTIELVKTFKHIQGENKSYSFDLGSNFERFRAHETVDWLISRFDGKSGLENSIDELYKIHDIITNKKPCDVIIGLGEWNVFIESK